MIQAADFIPPGLGFKEQERFINPTKKRLIAMMRWMLVKSPPELRPIMRDLVRDTFRAKFTKNGGQMSHSVKARETSSGMSKAGMAGSGMSGSGMSDSGMSK